MFSTSVSTPPAIPQGACDCHTHVFLDERTYPFSSSRKYTPPPAGIGELKQLLATLGLGRVVIVQPSVYGTDNAATLEGVRQIGLDRARAVAVISETASHAELEDLAAAGVRGIRVNFELKGEEDDSRAARHLEVMADKVAPLGWHIQIYAQLHLAVRLVEPIHRISVPVVFDHFAGASGKGGLDQPGLAAIVELVRDGDAYVKLSAAYRSSQRLPDYADLMPIARAFVVANADRILWGSDWPHPDPSRRPGTTVSDVSPPLQVDDPAVFALLAGWAGDEATYRKILRDNPARLYDF